MSVIDEIAAERQRQIEEEGWEPEHDDGHVEGSIAMAAAAYAWPPDFTVSKVRRDQAWPWHVSWWKPKTRRRDLIRAGALIVAEIERLDRRGREATEGEADG